MPNVHRDWDYTLSKASSNNFNTIHTHSYVNYWNCCNDICQLHRIIILTLNLLDSFFSIMHRFQSEATCNKCMLMCLSLHWGKILWCVSHLPLGGSHTLFTVLYCTTAEEHPTLYRACAVLQQSLPAVCWPQDSCKVQDRYFLKSNNAGQNVQRCLCEKTKIISKKLKTANAFGGFVIQFNGIMKDLFHN